MRFGKTALLMAAMLLLSGCVNGTAPDVALPTEAPTLAPTATPVTVELVVPTDPPTLTPTPTPTATTSPTTTPTPSPTHKPSPTPTPVPTPYSMVWLPDTQNLAYHYPERLAKVGDFIAAHIESDAVACVLHTGDIVDNGFKDWEWENFDQCLGRFYGSVPFVPVAGNHDIGVSAKSYKAYVLRPFLEAFPEEQKFEGGKMLYTVIEAGGEQWLLLGVGWSCGRTKAELDWIDAVMTEHADLPCLFFTHGYLTNQNRILPGCAYLEENIVKKYPNIVLAVSGHSRDYCTKDYAYDDDGDGTADRTVHTLMLNLQGKNYCFRVLTFDPVTHSVAVQTYSLDGEPDNRETKEYGPISFTIENAY